MVRAVAQVGASTETDDRSLAITAQSRAGRLGSFGLIRALVIEIMVAAPFAALKAPLWVFAAVTVVCLAVVVFTVGRYKGRWWSERIGLARRFRQRQRTAPAVVPDRRMRMLRTLAPDLTVTNAAGPDGSPVGIGWDSAGWYAVAVVSASSSRGAGLDLPLGRLAQLIADTGQAGALVQVVLHTVATPTPLLEADQISTESYRELLHRYGPVPASQSTWIAVRLDALTLAEISVGRADPSGQAPEVVAGLIRKVSRSLERAGVPTRVLDADGLVDALVYSCDLGVPLVASGGPPEPKREDRGEWRSATLAHACYWVEQWPEPKQAGDLIGVLSTTPGAAFTSVAVTLEPDADGVELRCLVRVAAPAPLLAASGDALVHAAGRAGARLLRLDVEQAPAVYATAPTGGGAR